MKDSMTAEWLDEIDSTNNEAIRRLNSLDNLSVLAAVRQTAGRGQRGNVWRTHDGENLTFSIVLKFGDGMFAPIAAKEQFDISRAVTLGIVDYLAGKGISAAIKWPNDIYVGNDKICGMLIENTLAGSFLASSIIGIGLNVNQKEFPPQLLNPTSVYLLTHKEFNIKEEQNLICEYILKRLLHMGEQDEEFLSKLYRFGRFFEYADCSDGSTFEGRIEGVTDFGLLKIETKEGEHKVFAFKEISYII